MPQGMQTSPLPPHEPVQQMRLPLHGVPFRQQGCGLSSVPAPHGVHPVAVLLKPDGQSLLHAPPEQPYMQLLGVCETHWPPEQRFSTAELPLQVAVPQESPSLMAIDTHTGVPVVHEMRLLVHWLLVPQAAPGTQLAVQVPLLQLLPVLQVVPPQQAWPVAPQETHW